MVRLEAEEALQIPRLVSSEMVDLNVTEYVALKVTEYVALKGTE